MGDDGQNPFWIIAIILIAFINWVSESLKKRKEVKRAEQERQEYIRQKANQPVKSTEPRVEAPQSKPAPQSQAREEIMDFFESLTGRPSPAKPQPAPTPVPVPIQEPPNVTAVIRPRSAEQERTIASYAIGAVHRGSRPANSSIRALLSSPGAARQAFLLKEILDTPKSLQE